MPRFYIILLTIFVLTAVGCATTYNPATGQKEFIFITTPVEVSIGNAVASKISRQFTISKDAQKIDRVIQIGERLIAVSDRKDLKYKFRVIEDDSLNAFTTPGGYIYINSGIIDKATDDELACVLGHEIGHVAARHIAKKLQAQIGYDILMNIAMRKSGVRDIQKAASVSYDLIMLGYSRNDELLADRLGVKYAYKAGYDPYAMITFLNKLNEKEMGFSFLRSHPYRSQRVKMLEKEIPVIMGKVDTKPVKNSSMSEPKQTLSTQQATANTARPKRVMCPTCRKIFPGKTTNYCPYCGIKLQ